MKTSTSPSNIKWKTLIGLLIILIAVIFNLNWVWGVLFIYWIIPSLYSGVTHFIEPIYKDENPVLFWVIILTWFLLSLYLILEPILLRLLEDYL